MERQEGQRFQGREATGRETYQRSDTRPQLQPRNRRVQNQVYSPRVSGADGEGGIPVLQDDPEASVCWVVWRQEIGTGTQSGIEMENSPVSEANCRRAH